MTIESRIDALERSPHVSMEPRESILARINAKLNGMRERLGIVPTPEQVVETRANWTQYLRGLRERMGR